MRKRVFEGWSAVLPVEIFSEYKELHGTVSLRCSVELLRLYEAKAEVKWSSREQTAKHATATLRTLSNWSGPQRENEEKLSREADMSKSARRASATSFLNNKRRIPVVSSPVIPACAGGARIVGEGGDQLRPRGS